MPKQFYKITYGRYGKYKIVSYFRIEENGKIILKVDTFHNKISRVKLSTLVVTHKRDLKVVVTEDEFIEALTKVQDTPISYNRNLGKETWN